MNQHLAGNANDHIYLFDIYVIKIDSPLEWAIIKNSRSADGSGPLYTVKLQDFKEGTVRRNNFIFTQGDFMLDYVSANYDVKLDKEPSHNGHAAHNLALFMPASSPLNLNSNGVLQNNKPGTNAYATYNPATSLYKAA